MKNKVLVFLCMLFLTGCFFSNYESKKVTYSGGNYIIQGIVNRTDKEAEDYAEVMIDIYDKRSFPTKN